MNNLINENTVAVVTGASGGVGRAVVRMLGERKASVGLIARGKDGLEGAKADVESRGGRALVLPADVSDAAAVEAAAAATESAFGPITLWINSAMVSMYSPFTQMSADEFKHIVEVTLLGSVHGVQAALKRMVPRDRGVIVQVGSALAYRSIPLQSAYCASKHGVKGFVESVRSELFHQKSSVRVSMVNLPGVNTTQFSWTKNRMPNEPRPAGPIYQPEVAADAILFMAENDRREMMLAYPTVQATLGEKVMPGVLDHYLAHAAWEGSQLPEPADHSKPDNFWQPLPGDHGAHGPFDEEAHAISPLLWASKHRVSLWAGALGLAAGAAAVLAKRRREN